jgi:plastocyanin
MHTRLTGVAVALAGAVLFAGCTREPAPNPPVRPDTIIMSNYHFYPQGIAVPAGTKISVVNEDKVPHTLTAQDRSFDTGQLPPGASATISAPRTPGLYHYFSMDQQYMDGFIKVG